VVKYKDCPSSGNVSTTSSDAYQLNLRQFLDTLPSNAIDNSGFFNGTTGSKNKVFGMAMCQADIPWPDQCKKCLQAASAGAPMDCPASNVRTKLDDERSVCVVYACVLLGARHGRGRVASSEHEVARAGAGDADGTSCTCR